jgi:hypothetical protein
VWYIQSVRNYGKYILLAIVGIALTSASCRFGGVGGAGWDDSGDVENAKRYPTTESNRISITTEEVPYGTFKQEFYTVFQDFPHSGNPVPAPETPDITKTQISGTPYSVSYERYVLKIFRDEAVIAERKLPRVFYMHPLSSGAILGKSRTEDIILCRTQSRGTTGLHYVFIADGNGEILFEKIIGAGEDWDILPSKNGDIVIGGARSKTTISMRK